MRNERGGQRAWAGGEIWRVPGGNIGGGIGGANAVSGAVIYEMNGYCKGEMNGGAAEKGGRHIFIAELYKCVYRE